MENIVYFTWLKRHLKNQIITLKSYLKQDDVAPIIILFDLDFNVKFFFLCLLQFLSDLKGTIISSNVDQNMISSVYIQYM